MYYVFINEKFLNLDLNNLGAIIFFQTDLDQTIEICSETLNIFDLTID